MSALADATVEGELTIMQAAHQLDLLMAQVGEGRAWTLDLSGVTELDTAGLQVLHVVARETAHRGGRLQVVSTSPAVDEVLRIAGLDLGLGVAS